MKSGLDMCFAPFKDTAKLLPVVDFLILQLFNRRSGNDQTVEVSVFNLVERVIKLLQMVLRSVDRLMG